MSMEHIKAQVHMLPTTDKTAPLGLDSRYKLMNSTLNLNPQHLYFTSDEGDKKEGMYVCNGKEVGKVVNTIVQGLHIVLVDDPGVAAEITGRWKPVVATTNPELWVVKSKIWPTGNVSAWSEVLPPIDETFILKHIEMYNAGTPITEVMLETEKDPTNKANWYVDCPSGKYWEDEPIPPSPDRLYTNSTRRLKLKPNGSVIVKPVKEEVYTRAELETAILKGIEHGKRIMTYYQLKGYGEAPETERSFAKHYPDN